MVSNRLLAKIARQGGGKLLNLAVGRLLPPEEKPEKVPLYKRTLTGGIASSAITRIATRSVPGAILVGGGLIAKALYDRRHKPKSRAELNSGKDA